MKSEQIQQRVQYYPAMTKLDNAAITAFAKTMPNLAKVATSKTFTLRVFILYFLDNVKETTNFVNVLAAIDNSKEYNQKLLPSLLRS